MDGDLLAQIDEIEARYDGEVLKARNAAIEANEEFSRGKLVQARTHIDLNPPPTGLSVRVLAVAGSLARLDASAASDLDLITTIEADTVPDAAHADFLTWRAKLCDALEMNACNPTGVFARPVSHVQVCNSAGQQDEDYGDVAKRILILLESTWLSDEPRYNATVDDIVSRYAIDVREDPRKNFVFLLNDVIRYFRAICVNYQFTKTATEDGKWPIRNMKLRHSRVLMYFSMVAAIGSLSRVHTDEKIPALKKLIAMPPLRRLHAAYELAEDGGFFKVAEFYNVFLQMLSDKEVRARLAHLDYPGRYSATAFSQLKANSDALSSELLRFFEARRRQWDDRFFEYMIL